MLFDLAPLLQEPENSRDLIAFLEDLCSDAVRKHPRYILIEAAAGDMGDGVDLVRSKRDLGVDAHKAHMTAVVLTRACAVELFIVEPCQLFAPFRIFPNPVQLPC